MCPRLARRYCPGLAPELVLADLGTAAKYCAVWHALETTSRNALSCEWVAWIDASAVVTDASLDLLRMVQPVEGQTPDALWFLAAEDEASKGCGSPDHFSHAVDASAFLLRGGSDGWLAAFVHSKLAMAAMPRTFLERSQCSTAKAPGEVDQCSAGIESSDACTTGCLVKHHPEFLQRMRCETANQQRPFTVSADDADHSRRLRQANSAARFAKRGALLA